MELLGRVIETLRAVQGQPLRCAALGRQLGVSRFRVWHCIELLESRGVLYTLPAWCPPPVRPGRRVAEEPVVYLRDPEPAEPPTPAKPAVPAGVLSQVSFRGRMIEQVMLRERARCPASSFGHYSTPAVTRAALVVVTPAITVGFQFPPHPCPSRRSWTGLSKSIREGWVDRGLVVYPGSRTFFAARWVVAVPASVFLVGFCGWMEALENGTVEALHRQVRASPTGSPA